jgi:predicted acylesterase/phospholipase RssA
MKLQLLDVQGRVAVERYQTRGGQVGGLAAALAEPQPFICMAEDPSVLLQLDYATAVGFARKYEAFRANMARMMGNAAKDAIYRQKAPVVPRVTAFFHRDDQTRSVTRRLFERLVELGETPHVFADRPSAVAGVDHCSLVQEGATITAEEIRRRSASYIHTGRIVFDVGMDFDAELAARSTDACEQIYWCVTAANWKDSVEPLGRLLAPSSSLRDKIRLVWLLEGGEAAPPAAELRSLAHGDVKVCLDSPTSERGRIVFEGLERLVHLMRGLQIGVALGGGAARGMAHLGVLPALARNGIVVDMIAGTSAGAMTGTLLSAGLSPEFLIDRFAADLRPGLPFRWLPRGDQWDLLYKYRRGRFDPMLRKYIGDLRLEQLYLPMHTITVDLVGGSEVVRSRGDAVHAIVESINLPLLSTPIRRDGEALVDGGLINNVPANVLAEKGCNFVIAVSVTAKMESEFAKNRPDTPADRMRRASTIQTLLRSYLVQSHSVNALGVQPADFVIEPDVTGFELSAFGETPAIAAVGDQTAGGVIAPIRTMLARLDPQLFT